MAELKELEQELKANGKTFLSIPDICAATGFGRTKVTQLLSDVAANGSGSGKRYFYKDVAKRILQEEGGAA